MTRIRVVLAEDHPEMAQHLRALIDTYYEVDVVADGQALIAAVNVEMPDIIITDIAMPGMSGLIAARSIRAAHPAARFIFVSVRDEPSVIRKALSEGALGYVIKSDAGDELMKAVQTVLAGGRYVSSSARAALKDGP